MSKTLKIFLFTLLTIVVLVSVLFGYTDIPIDELKAKYAPAPSEFVSVDGMEVHYRDEGSALGSLPIVLIHGTSSSLHTFDVWINELKNDRRVVRMDLPGFGLTESFSDQNYSIDKYVKFIEHFLLSQGIKKCILGGNSLGGEIAWRFAVKYPEMVDKLILIDAAGYPLESKSVPIAFRIAGTPVLNKMMTFITPRFMAKSSVENVYADKTKVNETLVDRYFELTLREGNHHALVQRMTTRMNTNQFQFIKNIQQPTLVLWGDQDFLITTKSAYRFYEDLPNSTLVILENSGHVPMEESPQESLEAVLAFLKE